MSFVLGATVGNDYPGDTYPDAVNECYIFGQLIKQAYFHLVCAIIVL